MKALIISDSHGMANDVMEAVERTKPDVIFHLGDGIKDCRGLGLMYPDIELHTVTGNCDVTVQQQTMKVVDICGIRIFMTHGHMFKVKQGIDSLVNTAKSHGADVILYGHTHAADFQRRDGILVINPGSLCFSEKYGVLTINNGEMVYNEYEL